MHAAKFTRFAGLAAATGAAAVLASCESEVPLTSVPELSWVVDPPDVGKFEVCKVGDTATFEVKVDGVLEQTIELADGECVIVHENTTDEALLVEVREVPAEGLDSIVVVTLLQKPGGGYGTIVQTFPGDRHDHVQRYIKSKKGAKTTFFNRPPTEEPCQECKGGIIELTLRNNGAAGMIRIDGDVDFEQFVESGAEFTFTGTGKKGKMKKDIKIFLDEEEVAKIHTSCSKPVGPGAVFGDFEVVRAVSKDKGVMCPIGEGEDCDAGKPQVLVVLYSGEDCDASSNMQGGKKVSCDGDPALTNPVFIRVSDKEKPDDKKAKVWFEGIVALNGTFDIDATNADEDKLKANTWALISDEEGGTVLQTVQFHTSCSQPLNEGDQFGSLLLIDFIPEP